MKGIHKDGSVSIFEGTKELLLLRHTAAHILAQAVKRLYPQTAFAYGPASEKGFYYDMDLGEAVISAEDLPRIEEEMRRICKENCRSSPSSCPGRMPSR